MSPVLSQVMWRHVGQRSCPLTEEQYAEQLQAVAELVTEWGCADEARKAGCGRLVGHALRHCDCATAASGGDSPELLCPISPSLLACPVLCHPRAAPARPARPPQVRSGIKNCAKRPVLDTVGAKAVMIPLSAETPA